MRKSLARLCNNLSDISGHFDIVGIGAVSKRQALSKVRNLFIIALINLPFCALNYYLLTAGDETSEQVGSLLVGIMIVTGGSHTILAFNGPLTTGVDLVLFFMVGYVSGHVQEWGSVMRHRLEPPELTKSDEPKASKSRRQIFLVQPVNEDNGNEKRIQAFDYETHLKLGLRLCQRVEEMNQTFGDLLFVVFASSLFHGTLTAFAVTGVRSTKIKFKHFFSSLFYRLVFCYR